MTICRFSSLCLGVLVVFLSGCQMAQVREPMRAIWVTRGDYKSPEDVTRIMDNCQQAGLNAVMFQVRGNGTVFYKSSIEPWADELGGTDPGWDPLALACKEAHARGMDLHAWVNVMPAWRGTKPPTNPEQLYNKHPEWFWYDQKGARQPLSSFYVSLNPCLPEVRTYLVDVYRDLVAHYDIDGLHMDYIRFPNEPPAIPEKSEIDYSYDARTLALYKQATGLTPDDDKERWNQWRTDQVTQLVADIHNMLRWTKSHVALTACVGTDPKGSLRHFRDDRRWANERLVEAVFPMNYVDNAEDFGKRLDGWGTDKPPIPVVPGLWFGRHRGQSPEEATADVKRQIELAREKTGNFCIFSYATLFDTRGQRDETRQSEERRDLHQVRQEILLPFLREMAEQKP